MKKQKKLHDYSKILDFIEAQEKKLEYLEDSFKLGSQYLKAHDAVVEYNTLYKLKINISLMQWEK